MIQSGVLVMLLRNRRRATMKKKRKAMTTSFLVTAPLAWARIGGAG